MRGIRISFFIALAAIGAFAQDVRYNFAADANFAGYKTYKWVQIKDADQPNQILDQQIRNAFDGELAKKGLTKTDAENADLLVAYQVSLAQEKQMTTFDNSFGYGPGWGRGWYGGGGGGISTSTTSTIQIGQVDFDMYDAAAKKLVWRGTASKTIDTKAKPDKVQKNLGKGVAKMLKNYPPPPKKS